MACATLKRSQNFDLLESHHTKRRKFTPYGSTCTATGLDDGSPFIPSEPATHDQLKRRIKEEIKRLQRRRLIPRFVEASAAAAAYSNFDEDNPAVASCSGSLRSMALRSPQRGMQESDKCQSPSDSSPSSPATEALSPPSVDSDTPTATAPATLSSPSSTVLSLSTSVIVKTTPGIAVPSNDNQHPVPLASGNNNTVNTSLISPSSCARGAALFISRSLDSVPIFTLPQVTSLCDRLIREREVELRQEYDNILSCKLAEQYEAFLKFSHDQMSTRFRNAPMSYVS